MGLEVSLSVGFDDKEVEGGREDEGVGKDVEKIDREIKLK